MKLKPQKVNFKNKQKAIADINLAVTAFNNNMKELSRKHLEDALKHDPYSEEALCNLVLITYQLFDFEKCLEYCERYFKAAKDPMSMFASYGADAGNRCSKFDQGIKWAKIHNAMCPSDPVCFNTLGVLYFKKHMFSDAIRQYGYSVTIQPNQEYTINNLGLAYKALGDYEKAIHYAKRMAEYNFNSPDVFKNLLTSYLYCPEVPFEEMEKAQKLWVDRFINKDVKFGPFKNNLNPNRKLRVGIVSSDLYAHPVGRNFLSVYMNTDSQFIEFVCYANIPKEDQITEAYKSKAIKFQNIHGMTDDQVARQIREDQCDVVIYLCPLFDSNRPLIAAYRAAPIQISYLDAGRTIIPNMDYLIIGRHFAPRRIKDVGVERIIGMPRFYQHPYFAEAPDLNELPALKNGYVTFGIFNNPAKINEQVLELWQKIANSSNCKFKFKYKGLWRNKEFQDKVTKYIPVDRCIFTVGDNNFDNHLSAYLDVDMQLDTFAFNGSTTTFESLTMGVPVITLQGENIMGCYGAGILKQAKLDEFVTKTKEEYVNLAVSFANNYNNLVEYRANIREKNVKEYLCMVKPYFFIRILKTLWRKYCKEATNGTQSTETK